MRLTMKYYCENHARMLKRRRLLSHRAMRARAEPRTFDVAVFLMFLPRDMSDGLRCWRRRCFLPDVCLNLPSR